MSTSCRGRDQGFSLVEVLVATAILVILLSALGATITIQAEVTGHVTDGDNVFLPAQVCLDRIRTELKSAVQDPAGLTATPSWDLDATSLTFRPAERYIADDDPDFSTYAAQGRISTNNILYAAFAKTVSYDSTAKTVTLSVSGTAPAGMPTSEVLASNVESFAFFNGESQGDTPSDADDETWVIGVRMSVGRESAAPGNGGSTVTSDRAGIVLTTKVLVRPETLINTKSKPAVGP